MKIAVIDTAKPKVTMPPEIREVIVKQLALALVAAFKRQQATADLEERPAAS